MMGPYSKQIHHYEYNGTKSSTHKLKYFLDNSNRMLLVVVHVSI